MMFYDFKIWLIDATGLSRDALHVYVAVALFLVVRMMWRGWRGSIAALLVVAAAALGGEWLDHQLELMNGGLCDRAEHWHDLRNTMFWPIMLALALPLLRPGQRKPTAPDEARPAVTSGKNAERGLEQT
ncbi:MAG: hypothetical protein U0S50_11000 [Sphingopyxis sp.]|uniref:hypothetical protein n=1 Tax=Sphingopyxis sp. TaxID=1908224 RepID=UPI002ABAEA79|nr:hypothetical protein [Sphingopyxis sp.]MDZ3832333.1 hypothetical protein [Sphingopyxis sp.]